MVSQIDPTVPIAGAPTTASVRANFQIAHDEIGALQITAANAPYLPIGGGRMTGAMYLANDPTDAMMPATKGYVDAGSGGGGGGGIPEAPADGTTYGRRNGGWHGAMPIEGGTMTGPLTLAADPTVALMAATKQYVDALAATVIPDAPNDGGFYARNNRAWAQVLALTGGVLSGSLGVNVPIPNAPAPVGPTVFSVSATLDQLFINAYQSTATPSWAYRAAGYAARLSINQGNGILAVQVIPSGAAGAAATWGAGLRFDSVGNIQTNAVTIPTDTVAQVMASGQLTVANAGYLTYNMYQNAVGWRYLAAGYGGIIYVNASGTMAFILYATAAANAAAVTAFTMTLTQAGLLTVGSLTANTGRIVSQLAGSASVTAYSTTLPLACGFWAAAAGQMALGALSVAGVPNAAWMQLTVSTLYLPANGAVDFVIQDVAASRYIFFASGGGYYWGYTKASGDLQWITANAVFFYMRTSDKLIFNNQGAIGGVGAYQNLSDARTKQDSEPLPYGLPEVLKLKPIRFRRITGEGPAAPLELGFTAQDVQPVIPEIVKTAGFGMHDGTGGLDDANPTLGIGETGLIPVLVNAIQTLNDRLTALEGKT